MNRSNLVAFPSVSSSLSSLPRATSMQNVALHGTGMYAPYAAQSEAMLQKAITKSAAMAQNSSAPAYQPPQPAPQEPDDSTLMMRSKSKF